MRRFLVLLMAALFIVSAAPVMAQNQNPPPGQGGGGGGEGKKQKLASYLDQLRKSPQEKGHLEQILRENLQKENAPNIDKRMSAIGPLLDQILKMDDATWKTQRDQMVHSVWKQAHYKKGSGGQDQGQQGQGGQGQGQGQGKQGQGKQKGGH